MKDIAKELTSIVGSEFVSNQPEEKYIYSRDMGTMNPANPDWIVMPDSVEEVQKIVTLANEEHIPIVPMGGGLTLSGLVRPLKGGIVMDLKRMNRIIEINEKSRYALVEAGTSQGMLQSYLRKNHPKLKHSAPDAPPIATIGGNVLIHGSGHLSQIGGFHSEMLNGLEAVIPTGKIVRLGSCAASPYWFSRSPLPDLAGLFIGWAGTTGIVTKLSIKLYPARRFNDILAFITQNVEIVPELIHQLTGVQVAEDIIVNMSKQMPGMHAILTSYSADTESSLALKEELLSDSVKKYTEDGSGGFVPLPPETKDGMMDIPVKGMTQVADEREGGGFEYVGAIMPIELYQDAFLVGKLIADRFGFPLSYVVRIVGVGHCMMFAFVYPFNRADDSDLKRVQGALEDTNREVLKLGGIPWKAEAPAQKQIIQQLDPGMFELMTSVRAVLDPNGIMNPGNWEGPNGT